MSATENLAGTYADVREYLDELDRRDLLVRVDRAINKDTEIMPLVRWQFRGLPQEQRKGWLFSNVTDSRGRTFDGSVAVAILGASPTVYAAAMGTDSPDGVAAKWAQAQRSPIAPRVIDAGDAPVKEVKILGDDVVSSGGVDSFPVTITNPGARRPEQGHSAVHRLPPASPASPRARASRSPARASLPCPPDPVTEGLTPAARSARTRSARWHWACPSAASTPTTRLRIIGSRSGNSRIALACSAVTLSISRPAR